MTPFRHDAQQSAVTPATNSKGFPVRTNLRAGLAWDELDDKAKELWNQVTSAVTNAVNSLTTASGASKPKA